MKQTNLTVVTYFYINGVTDIPELQAPIFLVILLCYFIGCGGNLTIILLVCMDPQLHTPMYFFLANLSLLDLTSTTVTLHKSIFSFISGDHTMSFLGCMTQMYMFTSLGCNMLLILTAMSYDRYVAICKPMHYHMVMNRKVCALLTTTCWVLSFAESIPILCSISSYTCYKSNVINHFICDIVPLKKLTCNDTSSLELYVFIEGTLLVIFTPLFLTFISYVFIVIAILRIRSSSGRRKTFYTCSSHLTVVVLLYVTIFCQYFIPKSVVSLNSNKLFSLFNAACVPMLNPLIYSLKNKDVKAALRRQQRVCKFTN